jgi:hypothetical protein
MRRDQFRSTGKLEVRELPGRRRRGRVQWLARRPPMLTADTGFLLNREMAASRPVADFRSDVGLGLPDGITAIQPVCGSIPGRELLMNLLERFVAWPCTVLVIYILHASFCIQWPEG